MREAWVELTAVLAAPAFLASSVSAAVSRPQAYDEIYWAAKWARWEASCNHKDAILWFTGRYGPRFQALRSRYVATFPETRFPELPSELADETIVWSCRIGYHNDKKRKFVRILKRQEIELGLGKR